MFLQDNCFLVLLWVCFVVFFSKASSYKIYLKKEKKISHLVLRVGLRDNFVGIQAVVKVS